MNEPASEFVLHVGLDSVEIWYPLIHLCISPLVRPRGGGPGWVRCLVWRRTKLGMAKSNWWPTGDLKKALGFMASFSNYQPCWVTVCYQAWP